MLPDTPDVQSVAEGPNGVLAGLAAAPLPVCRLSLLPPLLLVWIDMSTISPITSRRLASEAAARMASFLDAPVSGGQAAAKAGSLTIMVGGDLSAFQVSGTSSLCSAHG